MRKKNYKFEADYTEVVLNWRTSSEECGLSQRLWMKFNYEILNYLLDDFDRLALYVLLHSIHIEKKRCRAT